jgi:D-serine deaminase-like pyridoxal phosphate-dependent protein
MEATSRTVRDLQTPSLVVDLARMERNLDRAADYASAHALALRPHVKTHKSALLGAEQIRRGAAGLTCATPREAEVMSGVCDDLLLAYPPVGVGRAARIAALPRNVRVTVALDSAFAAEQASAAAREAGRELHVYVEVDVGMHRVGLPGVDHAIALARFVDGLPALHFDGIACYPGHVRGQVSTQDAALRELDAALSDAVARFTAADLAPRVVSAGSTPTLWRTHELASVTEMRPGTYIFNDRTTAAIGACEWSDCALTVLATVVSTAVPGQAVIDAGSKSLGREPLRGGALPSASDDGFGALLDRPEVLVRGMSEEHGILDLGATDWRPRVGDVVRVVPNHVCIVVHLFDDVAGLRGDDVVTEWAVDARGRRRATQPR